MKIHSSLKKLLCATTVVFSLTAAVSYAEGTYTVNGKAKDWSPTEMGLPSTSTTVESVIATTPQAGGNNIEVDAIVDANVVVSGAYTESSTDVSDNTLSVAGASELKKLYGGYVYHVKGDVNGGGDADRNSITVTGSTISGEVKAGYVRYQYGWAGETGAKTGSADNNSVTVTDSRTGSVAAGHAESGSGTAMENSVVVTNSTTGSVTGGSSSTGNANSNTVSISGNSTTSSVTGGTSMSGLEASNNTVTINDSTAKGNIYGGYQRGSSDGSANGNEVVAHASTLSGYVYGGYAKGHAEDNTVALSDIANKVNYVRGGYSEGSGVVAGNEVSMTNSAATYVHGGNTNGAGTATNNSVTLTNSSATFVYGGSTAGGTATNNTVTLDGCTMLLHTSGTATSKVFGGYNGYGSTGTASNNTVILKGVSDLSGADIYGGSGGVTADNKLQMEGLQSSINKVLKFDAIEQTGGSVTINSGELSSGKTLSIKGTGASTPAVLASGASNGKLTVKATESVTIENASLVAEGKVTIDGGLGALSIKDTTIIGTDFSVVSANLDFSLVDATMRTLDGVSITLVSGGVADLRYSTLMGGTTIGAVAAFSMTASSDEALTVLLDGSTVVLDESNTTVSCGSDGAYTINTTAFSGVTVDGDFTMDLSTVAPDISDFSSIDVQFDGANSEIAGTSDVVFVMNGMSYKASVNESGTGLTFTGADAVPEPTTATLSLLALAALAARRRRK